MRFQENSGDESLLILGSDRPRYTPQGAEVPESPSPQSDPEFMERFTGLRANVVIDLRWRIEEALTLMGYASNRIEVQRGDERSYENWYKIWKELESFWLNSVRKGVKVSSKEGDFLRSVYKYLTKRDFDKAKEFTNEDLNFLLDKIGLYLPTFQREAVFSRMSDLLCRHEERIIEFRKRLIKVLKKRCEEVVWC